MDLCPTDFPSTPNALLDGFLDCWEKRTCMDIEAYGTPKNIPLTSSCQEVIGYYDANAWLDSYVECLSGQPSFRNAQSLAQPSAKLLQEIVLCILDKCPVSEIPKLNESQDRVFSVGFSTWAWRFLDSFLVKIGLVDVVHRKKFFQHANECLPNLFDQDTLLTLETELHRQVAYEEASMAALEAHRIFQTRVQAGGGVVAEDLQGKFYVEGAATIKVEIRPIARSRRTKTKLGESQSLTSSCPTPESASSLPPPDFGDYQEYTEETLATLMGFEQPATKRARTTKRSAF